MDWQSECLPVMFLHICYIVGISAAQRISFTVPHDDYPCRLDAAARRVAAAGLRNLVEEGRAPCTTRVVLR